MKRLFAVFAALITAWALCLCTAYAGLIDDTLVGTRYVGSGGGTTPVAETGVGTGEEGGIFNNQMIFDYGDFSFSIRSTRPFGGIFASVGTVDLELTSLDFGSPLTNVTFSTSLSGVSNVFGDDFVTFTWNEQSIPSETYLTANFNVGSQSVPEPASLALVLAGLAGLRLVSRRHKS